MSKQENIDELFITAENFIRNNIDSENIIDDFLDNAALEAGDYQSKLDNDPVQLMTIHSAKGLEFPVVFLTGLEEEFSQMKTGKVEMTSRGGEKTLLRCNNTCNEIIIYNIL